MTHIRPSGASQRKHYRNKNHIHYETEQNHGGGSCRQGNKVETAEAHRRRCRFCHDARGCGETRQADGTRFRLDPGLFRIGRPL